MKYRNITQAINASLYNPDNDEANQYIAQYVHQKAPTANKYLRQLEQAGLEEYAGSRALTFIQNEQDGRANNRFIPRTNNRSVKNLRREAEEINLFLSRPTHTVEGARKAEQSRKQSLDEIRQLGYVIPESDAAVKKIFKALGNYSNLSRDMKYEIIADVEDIIDENSTDAEVQLAIDRMYTGEILYNKILAEGATDGILREYRNFMGTK